MPVDPTALAIIEALPERIYTPSPGKPLTEALALSAIPSAKEALPPRSFTAPPTAKDWDVDPKLTGPRTLHPAWLSSRNPRGTPTNGAGSGQGLRFGFLRHFTKSGHSHMLASNTTHGATSPGALTMAETAPRTATMEAVSPKRLSAERNRPGLLVFLRLCGQAHSFSRSVRFLSLPWFRPETRLRYCFLRSPPSLRWRDLHVRLCRRCGCCSGHCHHHCRCPGRSCRRRHVVAAAIVAAARAGIAATARARSRAVAAGTRSRAAAAGTRSRAAAATRRRSAGLF